MLIPCYVEEFSTDVIGQLTVIHPVIQSSGLNGMTVRRLVDLRDLRLVSVFVYTFVGNYYCFPNPSLCCSDWLLQVTLWAKHATTFEDEFLAETADKDEPVVIVFAGMHVRQYLGGC
jgi:hypothetical protein